MDAVEDWFSFSRKQALVLFHQLMHDTDRDACGVADFAVQVIIHVGDERVACGPRGPFCCPYGDDERRGDQNGWSHLWPVDFPMRSHLFHRLSIGED